MKPLVDWVYTGYNSCDYGVDGLWGHGHILPLVRSPTRFGRPGDRRGIKSYLTSNGHADEIL